MMQMFARSFCVALFLSPVFCFGADNQLTQEEQEAGWLLLFDGGTKFGWRAAGKANWKVENGIVSATEGEICLLRTTSQFSDYILKVDFRADTETNSGIFLRTSPKPKQPGFDCYELNIAPQDNPFPTGSFVKQKRVEGAPNDGEWHSYEITMDKGNCLVQLDGQTILQFVDPKPLGKGFIGLQHNSGKIEFKNVKLKPLGGKSIFNGKDLTGWKTYPDMPAKFEVTPEGNLHLTGGKGQLESHGQYGNFVLQLDCFINGDLLNSGIFFRCIPGDIMMGYESQLSNDFKEGDRTNPVDHGTGGIFRRTEARRIVANNREWFTKTILADGPHMAVWVNGIQVSDWTDQRKPDPNPRRGLRVEPGTIIIQGHDPPPDFLFKNIKILDIADRWKARTSG